MTSENESKISEDMARLRIQAITANPNDIIKLNVGGEKMTTKRSTLCQIEGSFLSSMFSGRWEDSLEQDNDGYVFLDYNPRYFVLVLDYLRARLIATPDRPVFLPKVEPDQMMHFKNFIDYLGLQDGFPANESKCVFGLHSRIIKIKDDTIATNRGDCEYHGFALSKNIYRESVVSWRLVLGYSNKIITRQRPTRKEQAEIFLGILKNDPTGTVVEKYKNRSDVESYYWNESFGWILSPSGVEAVIDKKRRPNVTHKDTVTAEDVVELTLDGTNGTLTASFVTSQQKLFIPVPKQTTWRLHVNLTGNVVDDDDDDDDDDDIGTSVRIL